MADQQGEEQLKRDADINRLDRTHHVAGAIGFEDPRTLAPQGIVPTMPPPDCLVPYIHEAGFGGPLQMQPFDYDMPLVSALVERWMWPIISDCAQTVTRSAGACGTSGCGMGQTPGRWLRNVWANVPRLEGEELCWGEDDLAEAASADDSGVRGSDGCVAAHSIVGLGRSVLDIPPPLHREQARQHGDERVSALVLSWIYQRFLRFCPPSRSVMVFPLVSRLNGLALTTRDTHARRQLEFRNELDRVGVDDFMWTPYMAPQWRAIELAWVNEAGEIQTWLATVPIVLFMYVRFHHADRVKRQFGGATTDGGLMSLHTDTASGATGCPEIIRFKSCPPDTPVGPIGNTLTGGQLPVARIAYCKIPGDFSCRVMCPQLRLRRDIRSSFRAMPQPAEDGCGCSVGSAGSVGHQVFPPGASEPRHEVRPHVPDAGGPPVPRVVKCGSDRIRPVGNDHGTLLGSDVSSQVRQEE
ncbi:hypothetical protein PIB30_031234 [Stylosanthes scabra]|uniref:Aminotransferase-like plant mobile domain-containing protein n=1 Tax=Stylosanthes scabra TaxID=79078 RepID=A0ABU6UDM1_9FABA|nr:hypothetical protein [Stylosanthes scabra]